MKLLRSVFLAALIAILSVAVRADVPAGHPRFVQNAAKAQDQWFYQSGIPDGQDKWQGYCNQANTQSPVMIRPLKSDEVVEDATLDPLVIDFPKTHAGRFILSRTSKTVVFAPMPDEKLTINATGAALVKGVPYAFQQAYFHSPSEHLIEGLNTDLEWTFVFRDTGVKSQSPLEEHPLQAPAPPKEDPHKKRLRLLKEKAQEQERFTNVREAIEASLLEAENEVAAEFQTEADAEAEAEVEVDLEAGLEAEGDSNAQTPYFKKQMAEMKKKADQLDKRQSANFAHVSILFTVGEHNPHLEQLLQEFKGNLDLKYRKAVVEFNWDKFFSQFEGENSAYFTYAGSHTAPPCRADVVWTIYAKVLELSNAQLQKLREYTNDGKDNRRDVQSLGKRKILAYAYNPAKAAAAAAHKASMNAAAAAAKQAELQKKAAEEQAKKVAEEQKKAAEAAAEKAKAEAEAAAQKAKADEAAAKKAKEDAEAAAALAKLEAQRAAGGATGAAKPAAKPAFRQKVMARVLERASEYLKSQQ